MIAVLHSLVVKLKKLTKRDFRFYKPIATGFLDSVNTRFESYFTFNSNQALNAGVTALAHPESQARWMQQLPLDTSKILKNFIEAAIAGIHT